MEFTNKYVEKNQRIAQRGIMGFSLRENERILVVAPHSDDESIGCGGLLAMYGKQCDVLLLTDGRKGKSEKRKDLSDEEIVFVRKQELRNSLTIAGVQNMFCLDIPDSTLKKSRKQVMSFDVSGYRYIFVPNAKEDHPDHKAANRFFKAMRFWGKTKARIYEYEVWTPLQIIDVLLDISEYEEKKEQMIKQFVSQLECKDYLNAGMGLSHYRGIGCNSIAAEAFYYSPASVMDKIKKFVSRILP